MTFGQFSIDYVFWGAIMSTEIENDYRSYLLKTWILIWLRVVGICILQKGVVIYMKKFGKVVVKLRIPILVLSFLLLIPSVLGYFNTRVNYDILYYLPSDIETNEPAKIAKIYVTVYYAEKGEQKLLHLSLSWDSHFCKWWVVTSISQWEFNLRLR